MPPLPKILLILALLLLAGCVDTSGIRIGNVLEKRGTLPVGSAPHWTLATAGGEHGREITVSNLAASGPGSLAEALAAKGPRRVRFAVGGVIDLGGKVLSITEPFLTLDAAEAPEPGITLIRGGLSIATHDVIIRHLRVRPGEAGFAKRSGWEVDGINTVGGAHDVLVEQCSISWATDENLSASGPRFEGNSPAEWRRHTSHRIVFRLNLLAEGLSHSTHTDGEHSKGMLIHDNVTEIAIIGNAFVSNRQRNPFFKGGTRAIVANNLIHNPGLWAIHADLIDKEWGDRERIPSELAIVGNVIQPGPNTLREMPIGNLLGGCRVFVHDNRFDNPATFDLGVPWVGKYTELKTLPFWLEGFSPKPSSEVREWILQHVGARPWARDAVDRRLIEEIRNRSGSLKNSEREAGDYPVNP